MKRKYSVHTANSLKFWHCSNPASSLSVYYNKKGRKKKRRLSGWLNFQMKTNFRTPCYIYNVVLQTHRFSLRLILFLNLRSFYITSHRNTSLHECVLEISIRPYSSLFSIYISWFNYFKCMVLKNIIRLLYFWYR